LKFAKLMHIDAQDPIGHTDLNFAILRGDDVMIFSRAAEQHLSWSLTSYFPAHCQSEF